MNVTVVASTTLATVAYHEAVEILQLEFRSRAVYQLLRGSRRGARKSSEGSFQGQVFQRGNSRTFRHARVAKAGKA